jgi:hypothetical protein
VSRALSPDTQVRRAWLVAIALLSPLPASAETACTKAERAAYFDSIERAIYANWRVPYENENLSCKVLVKQDFRGEVRDVGIAMCGDDMTVRRSIINATYRASPMPLPDNRTCFAESVIVTIESRTQPAD